MLAWGGTSPAYLARALLHPTSVPTKKLVDQGNSTVMRPKYPSCPYGFLSELYGRIVASAYPIRILRALLHGLTCQAPRVAYPGTESGCVQVDAAGHRIVTLLRGCYLCALLKSGILDKVPKALRFQPKRPRKRTRDFRSSNMSLEGSGLHECLTNVELFVKP